jgi:hypothetical protein
MSKVFNPWRHADSWLLLRYPRIWALRLLHVVASAIALGMVAWILPTFLFQPTLSDPIRVQPYATIWVVVLIAGTVVWVVATWRARRTLPLRYSIGQIGGPVTSALVIATLASPVFIAICSAESANRKLSTKEELVEHITVLIQPFEHRSGVYDVSRLDRSQCIHLQSLLIKFYLFSPSRRQELKPGKREYLEENKEYVERMCDEPPAPGKHLLERHARDARPVPNLAILVASKPSITLRELARAHGLTRTQWDDLDALERLPSGLIPKNLVLYYASFIGLLALFIANLISAMTISIEQDVTRSERDVILMVMGLTLLVTILPQIESVKETLPYSLTSAIWSVGLILWLFVSLIAESRRNRTKRGDRLLSIALLSPVLGLVATTTTKDDGLLLAVLAIYFSGSPLLQWAIDRYRRIPHRY